MALNSEMIKEILYSGIISDVLDGMGYRNQALAGGISPLTDDTVIFGPAFPVSAPRYIPCRRTRLWLSARWSTSWVKTRSMCW